MLLTTQLCGYILETPGIHQYHVIEHGRFIIYYLYLSVRSHHMNIRRILQHLRYYQQIIKLTAIETPEFDPTLLELLDIQFNEFYEFLHTIFSPKTTLLIELINHTD